jgi:hypothetical protein
LAVNIAYGRKVKRERRVAPQSKRGEERKRIGVNRRTTDFDGSL